MIDWTKSMQQTFKYYKVDPNTWKDKEPLNNVISCSIDRDSEMSTLGSSSFSINELIDECYVRVYLVAIQNGLTYKTPLATHMIQSPSDSFDGKKHSIVYDGYTPLIELSENNPPIGYYVAENENTMKQIGMIVRDNVRAPVTFASSEHTLYSDFLSNSDDTWLSFLSDLMVDAKYVFDVDPDGRILFAPKQDLTALSPVWTYNDNNSSILYPSVSVERDLYEIPNTVEVYYSNGAWNYYSIITNDDPNSPTSTVARGRVITYRVTNPDLVGVATQHQVDEYAKRLLRELSSLEYTITYTHGYCPVRVNDCVRLNYERAGLVNIKAKVISQHIECSAGCKVTETAVYTQQLWGGD